MLALGVAPIGISYQGRYWLTPVWSPTFTQWTLSTVKSFLSSADYIILYTIDYLLVV